MQFVVPSASTEIVNLVLAGVLLLISVCQWFLVWQDSIGMMRTFTVLLLVTILKSLLDEVLSPIAGVWFSLVFALFLGVVMYKLLEALQGLLIAVLTFLLSFLIIPFIGDHQQQILGLELTWFTSMALWAYAKSKNGRREEMLNIFITLLCSLSIVYTLAFFLSTNYHHFSQINRDIYSAGHCMDKRTRCRMDLLLVFSLSLLRLAALLVVVRRRRAKETQKDAAAEEEIAKQLEADKKLIQERYRLAELQRARIRMTNAREAFATHENPDTDTLVVT